MNLYIIFGDGLTNDEAFTVMAKCKKRCVAYYAQYVDNNHSAQDVAIGPITKGDIDKLLTVKSKMSVWRLQNEY